MGAVLLLACQVALVVASQMASPVAWQVAWQQWRPGMCAACWACCACCRRLPGMHAATHCLPRLPCLRCVLVRC